MRHDDDPTAAFALANARCRFDPVVDDGNRQTGAVGTLPWRSSAGNPMCHSSRSVRDVSATRSCSRLVPPGGRRCQLGQSGRSRRFRLVGQHCTQRSMVRRCRVRARVSISVIAGTSIASSTRRAKLRSSDGWEPDTPSARSASGPRPR